MTHQNCKIRIIFNKFSSPSRLYTDNYFLNNSKITWIISFYKSLRCIQAPYLSAHVSSLSHDKYCNAGNHPISLLRHCSIKANPSNIRQVKSPQNKLST